MLSHSAGAAFTSIQHQHMESRAEPLENEVLLTVVDFFF